MNRLFHIFLALMVSSALCPIFGAPQGISNSSTVSYQMTGEFVYEDTSSLNQSNSHLVRIVDERTGFPVGNCTLSVVPISTFRGPDYPSSLNCIAERVSQVGNHYKVSWEGEVRLPPIRTHSYLVVHDNKIIGFTPVLENAPQEFKISMGGEIRLSSQVVDGKGRPQAGVDVIVESSKTNQLQFKARTNQDGFVYFHLPKDAFKFSKDPLYLSVLGIQSESNRIRVDFNDPPKDPVLLRVQNQNPLRIRVLTPDGRPCLDPLSLMVTWATTQTWDSRIFRFQSEHYWGELLSDGALTILAPTPTPNLRIRIEGTPASGWMPVTVEVDQTTLDETPSREVVIRLKKKWPALKGKLLGSAKRPYGDANVNVLLGSEFADEDEDDQESDPQTVYDRDARTQGDGTFLLYLDQDAPIEEKKHHITIRRYGRPDSQGSLSNASSQIALQRLHRFLPDTILDIGTQTFGSSNSLARGTVLDIEGRPVANAHITLMSTNPSFNSQMRFKVDAPDGSFSNTQGQFVFHGTTQSSSFRVQVTKNGLQSAPTRVKKGQEGIVLKLTQTKKNPQVSKVKNKSIEIRLKERALIPRGMVLGFRVQSWKGGTRHYAGTTNSDGRLNTLKEAGSYAITALLHRAGDPYGAQQVAVFPNQITVTSQTEVQRFVVNLDQANVQRAIDAIVKESTGPSKK